MYELHYEGFLNDKDKLVEEIDRLDKELEETNPRNIDKVNEITIKLLRYKSRLESLKNPQPEKKYVNKQTGIGIIDQDSSTQTNSDKAESVRFEIENIENDLTSKNVTIPPSFQEFVNSAKNYADALAANQGYDELSSYANEYMRTKGIFNKEMADSQTGADQDKDMETAIQTGVATAMQNMQS